jgi:hypothetical protein
MLSHILKDENAVEQQHLNGDSRDEDEYHLADCPPWVVDKACCKRDEPVNTKRG